MQLSIPQIPIAKGGVRYNNRDFLLHLHNSPQFGSLGLKYWDYHERHIFMNELICRIYTLHELEKKFMQNEKPHSLRQEHRQIIFSIETLVYWLRKNVDEMIGFSFYLDFLAREGKEPKKLVASSIGGLLKNDAMKAKFKDHIMPLERLNEISNTYKHSFVTSEAHVLIGRDEPVVNCLDLKRNSVDSPLIHHSFFLREMISDYVSFFEYCRIALQAFEWPSLPPRANDQQ